ncbi:ubiquitin-associated protein 1 [Hypomesus transpacificus]|uniref:ubiquitin-associated protein 1 n=1 Tax=Hypomesus transpacificus TaxID=137520 RepID=UPI001F0802AB|nr:ubiquitin-associated protein 1 [Hypomesus transpacificus]XP_046881568.1 ubiquitin-associated protein 1 [Hypomesus transpacificus]
MAARKSGADTYNNGPISYLDDVPFKINDKFRCPAKVGLPVGFCLPDCGSVLTDLQYDFSLERRSVRWGLELAEARAAEARAVEAAIARAESDSREDPSPMQDGGGKRPRPAEEHDPPPPALNPVLAGLRHNAILTPLPAPSLARQTQPSLPQLQRLNLADFEREEDPFDKLELKTLDDKEELRSILQSQPQPLPPASPPEAIQSGPTSRGNSPSPPAATTNTCLPAKTGYVHKPNGLVALLDMDRSRGTPEADDRPCNIRSLTFPKLSDPGDLCDPVLMSCNLNPISIPSPRILSNGSPPALQKNDIIGRQELHSHTQNGAPKQTHAVPGSGPAPLPCGGGLLSLSPSERQCVETIVGMGYSYEGVLRAMQKQGQNVEQVLDYLFVHTRLCERGFDATAVEECLEMYQCSEEKALEFLQLMSRFGEMGFERDAIKEVLLVHNNDQDKALEDLMGRATAS